MTHEESFSFASIGSGSKGNATIVSYNGTVILLDCGFSVKETEKRLSRLSISPEQLTGVLVTHEHGDHISGVGALARKYNLPVYLTSGTHRNSKLGKISDIEYVVPNEEFHIEHIHVVPVPVPHDAAEPVQYVFNVRDHRLGVLTDVGSITPHVIDHYHACDAVFLEANHCISMLYDGPYPESLKQRVGGDWGHLSNEQAAQFLKCLTKPLKHLVLGHLSEQNNHPDRVRDWLEPYMGAADQVSFACQQNGTQWLTIT